MLIPTFLVGAFIVLGYAIYRYFEGPTPILMSSDLDFLKEVFIKNFSKFNGRKYFPVQPDPVKDQICSMFMAQGQRWKRLRTISNPSFTPAKLKYATEMMNRKSRILLKKLEQTDEICDILPLFQELALDIIGESAFGIEINAQGNVTTPLLDNLRVNLNQNPLRNAFFATLPELRFTIFKGLRALLKFMGVPTRWEMMDEVGKVLEMRRKQPQRNPPDLMQLMIDAEVTSYHGSLEVTMDEDQTTEARDESVEIELSEAERVSHAGELAQKKLTIDEIKLQGVLFLVAGYETTSTTLSACAHALATNPEKQQLLYEEINENIQDDEDLTYEKMQGLLYLDMALREILRMYPAGALSVHRRCIESCTINGWTIPQDMVIQANVCDVHNNADIWGPTDPKIFEPERFSDKRKAQRHPLAWLPFGAGPRNCIGLRFALLEAKIVLAKLIKKFRIVPYDQTKASLELAGIGVISPKDRVVVKLQRRDIKAVGDSL